MQTPEQKANYLAIQNSIGQLRVHIKLMGEDDQLVEKALKQLDKLENLFKEKEDKCVK